MWRRRLPPSLALGLLLALAVSSMLGSALLPAAPLAETTGSSRAIAASGSIAGSTSGGTYTQPCPVSTFAPPSEPSFPATGSLAADLVAVPGYIGALVAWGITVGIVMTAGAFMNASYALGCLMSSTVTESVAWYETVFTPLSSYGAWAPTVAAALVGPSLIIVVALLLLSVRISESQVDSYLQRPPE